jgi:hypothetical protein
LRNIFQRRSKFLTLCFSSIQLSSTFSIDIAQPPHEHPAKAQTNTNEAPHKTRQRPPKQTAKEEKKSFQNVFLNIRSSTDSNRCFLRSSFGDLAARGSLEKRFAKIFRCKKRKLEKIEKIVLVENVQKDFNKVLKKR